jgi:aryl-alcohol dehydrogenase-like predicted oxidoreductase
MPLSLAGRPDRKQGKSVIRHAVERGVTLIDTADSYARDDTEIGHNERLIAEALGEMGIDIARAAEGDGPLVATKGGMTRPGGRWSKRGSPEHLRAACHASLVALGVERIPLYQLHWPDPEVPFAESLGEIMRLRDEGKVALVGISNVTVEQIDQAEAMGPIASVQNRLSAWDVGYRFPPVVRRCERSGIVFLAYAPLGGSGRAKPLGEENALQALASELRATPQELALAWLLHLAPVVVPIPGATRTASVDSSLRALDIELDDETMGRLGRAFRRLPGRRGLLRRAASKLKRLIRRRRR